MSDPETMTAAPDAPAARAETARFPLTRVFGWLVRREYWEHRSLWIAPLAVAGFAVLLHFLAAAIPPYADRIAALADPAKSGQFMGLHSAVIGVVIVTGQLVGVLYCLGALQSERRDRSILFWKSLPVSDRATVLSKAAVAIVLLPLFTAVLAVAASAVAVTLQTFAWQVTGFDPAELWKRLDMSLLWLGVAYGLPFMMLWNAPLYAWMLLASAWARRSAALWALAPFVAFLMVEHTVLHKTHAHWMLERRLAGGVIEPYGQLHHDGAFTWIRSLSELDPVRLWTLPGLWIGLAVAALFLFAAIRLRRSRAPL